MANKQCTLFIRGICNKKKDPVLARMFTGSSIEKEQTVGNKC